MFGLSCEKTNESYRLNSGSSVVDMVNPHNCYFIAHYPNKIIKGNNLFDTGWKEIPDGITKIQYQLSTGKLIDIPQQFDAYLHLVEVSQSVYGDRLFHTVIIKGLTNTGDIVDYTIMLKQDKISNHKIGDILVSKAKRQLKSAHWKTAAR